MRKTQGLHILQRGPFPPKMVNNLWTRENNYIKSEFNLEGQKIYLSVLQFIK